MQSLSLHSAQADNNAPLDLAAEVARLECLLTERQQELTTRQEELREFRTRYTQIVGSRLAELAEIEQSIREAEARLLGVEQATEDAGAEAAHSELATEKLTVERGLRKLFWSVAKLFHPDHAADESEARRRHTIMVEAGRAYREGDVESLHTLLGDEELHFFCTAAASTPDDDLPARLVGLKEELRTVEFGFKRLMQDGMYRHRQKAAAETAAGRDWLAAEAGRIGRQIAKARHRLTNLN